MQNDAAAEAYEIKNLALAYKTRRINVAKAEQNRFLSQLKAYSVAPEIFKLRMYLDFLKNDCKDVRKYVLSSDLQGEVYELNLEEKERLNLLDADLGE
jgi:regulator of protease activity HflC (stomatin/prohibitin superfamily)